MDFTIGPAPAFVSNGFLRRLAPRDNRQIFKLKPNRVSGLSNQIASWPLRKSWMEKHWANRLRVSLKMHHQAFDDFLNRAFRSKTHFQIDLWRRLAVAGRSSSRKHLTS